MKTGTSLLTLLLLSTTLITYGQNNAPQAASVDSTAYYGKTRKAAISDPQITEYTATIRADGKRMVLQTNSLEKEGRYKLVQYSLNSEGKWGHPADLDSVNNTPGTTIGGPSLSYDGNSLYYFIDNDIYYSVREKDQWSKPIRMEEPINTAGYEAFPSISADGKTLYFVGAKDEGPRSKELRKQDSFCTCILKSEKGEDGKWGKPERLPVPINYDCEKAPRIMADGKTLIFSSNRIGGKGGHDIYQTKLTPLGTWTVPVPLDFVNSEFDDQAPSISAQGDLMYYTHNNKDIYTITIPPRYRQFKNSIITGFVTDQETGSGLPVDIVVTDAFTSRTIMTLDNNPVDGAYTVVLPIGGSFNIEFKKEGYSGFVYSADLARQSEYKEVKQDVALFKSVKLTLHLIDKEVFEPVTANVKIREKSGKVFLYDKNSNASTGLLTVELPIGKDYEMIINSQGFKGVIEEFNTSSLIIYREYDKFIEMEPEKKSVMINVADIHNNGKIKAKVVLRNKDRNEIIEISGNEMVQLRAGDRYEIEVTSEEGYAFDSKSIDLSIPGAVGGALDFKLQKLERDARLTLKDINFESNSDKLDDTSYSELNRVIKMLFDNPSLVVEIGAHTDDIGSDVYNQVLSSKRAQSVVNYLKNNQIMDGRYLAKGFGEKMAKVPNDNDENRQINRRVELKIVGI